MMSAHMAHFSKFENFVILSLSPQLAVPCSLCRQKTWETEIWKFCASYVLHTTFSSQVLSSCSFHKQTKARLVTRRTDTVASKSANFARKNSYFKNLCLVCAQHGNNDYQYGTSRGCGYPHILGMPRRHTNMATEGGAFIWLRAVVTKQINGT